MKPTYAVQYRNTVMMNKKTQGDEITIRQAALNLGQLFRGKRYVYHIGNLAYDRQFSISADCIATMMLEASKNDKVCLVQERITETKKRNVDGKTIEYSVWAKKFNYIAIGR